MRRRWPQILFAIFVGYWALVAVLLLVVLMRSALAQGHEHPTETITGDVARYYESWMRPDNRMVSCCNRQDCSPVGGVRQRNGRLEAMRREDGAWLVIPPEKIERDKESPDAAGHMCSRGATVFCFVAGTGG